MLGASSRAARPPRLANLNVYLDPQLQPPQRQQMVARCGSGGATVVDALTLADLVVASRLSRPPSLADRALHFHARLAGAAIATVQFILTGSGAAMAWRAAVGKPRKLYVSASWRRAHPRLSTILSAAVARAQSRWAEVYVVEFVTLNAQVGCRVQHVALVADEEIHGPALRSAGFAGPWLAGRFSRCSATQY